MSDDGRADLIASMVAASDKVRHPSLPLSRFVSTKYYDLLGEYDDEEDALAAIPAAEIETARARRGSIILAAEEISDQCINDLQEIQFYDGMPDPDRAAESFVYDHFPQRHQRAYNERFFRKVLITAVKVVQDLADPNGPAAACTAEEIIRQCIGHLASSICELAELDEPDLHLDDALLEDLDFESLYEDDMDGIEDDPARQATMGITVPSVDNWFSPFGDDTYYIVHPYAETPRVDPPAMHDLFNRVHDVDTHRAIFESPAINSPEPLTGLHASSDVVTLARRQAATDAGPDLWVPDETDPERSFANLVSVAREADHGSGWLTWEPHEEADFVRTDPVVSLTPYRHFPIGTDQPWIWAAVGGGRLLAIPLAVVVSYRPDASVRHRWNNAFAPPDAEDD